MQKSGKGGKGANNAKGGNKGVADKGGKKGEINEWVWRLHW